ncbi:MAG: GNAT family N-acetyltransferase [Chloroflexi bacterium]|nr:MAG: GNAT family N-acetyltransferase [Chloroflexota bacterium]
MTHSEIVIRACRPEDAAAVVAILGQRSSAAMTLQIPYSTEAEWQSRIVSDATNRILVAEIDGRVVGQTGLHLSTRRRAHVGGLGMAVLEEYRGRGVGAALLGAVIDLADNWYNLLRLELQVYTDNSPAVRLYERNGFVIEGTHRAFAFRLGEFVDVYTMARLRRPPQLNID